MVTYITLLASKPVMGFAFGSWGLTCVFGFRILRDPEILSTSKSNSNTKGSTCNIGDFSTMWVPCGYMEILGVLTRDYTKLLS